MSFLRDFQNPSCEYRGKPFWSWNGRLDPEELRRQLRIFKQMGLGGAFLHSRVGLATEYLGEEWFECIGACIEECRRLGLEAWLYDEDRWPSGSAGGLATRDPKYRMRHLVMEVLTPGQFKGHRGLLGVWEGRIRGDRLTGLKRLRAGQKPSGKQGYKVIAFRVELMEESSWYNGYTYLDTLAKEAVEHFVRLTHRKYTERLGDELGKTVKGIFTDEPNYLSTLGGRQYSKTSRILPWTPRLPQVFKERYGYDIRSRLPELFFHIDGEEVSAARVHYRDCLTHLFVENFGGTCARWCEESGVALTGHVLFEGTLRDQTFVVGSAMRFYEKMHAPGIDVLTQFSYEYDTAKQCSSVLHQTGRKWMLSELYGCTGWDFSFEGHKAAGDWQAALGVNLRCQHLSFYTMQGEAKRDYPASISYQSPWWREYRTVEDYFSRLHVALTQGNPVRRLLVIHPVESMWSVYVPTSSEDLCLGSERDSRDFVDELNRMLPTLSQWLLAEHLDFDYGDEEMLSRLASVRRSAKEPTIRVGKAEYNAILVPPLKTIRGSTLKLLKRFQKTGGTVVFAGEPPHTVEAEISDEAIKVAKQSRQTSFMRRRIAQALENHCREVSILDSAGRECSSVLYMLRQNGPRRILFVCNTDRKQGTGPLTIRLKSRGVVIELDASNGERCRCESDQDDDWLVFETNLPASGSRLFMTVAPSSPVAKSTKPPRIISERRRQTLNLQRGISLSEPNVLVLDRPRYRIEGGQWKAPEEILRVDRQVRDHLGLQYRGGQMVQPWAAVKEPNAPRATVDLLYRVEVKDRPRSATHLAIETPERFRITLNETALSADSSDGWWVDPGIRTIPIDPALLREGQNELLLSIDYGPEDGLETAFLLGDFGVKVSGTECCVVKAVDSLRLGSWTTQGLPFYGGSVAYSFSVKPGPRKGERVFLCVPEFKGTLARVLFDGRKIGTLAWPPFEIGITDYADGGRFSIQIEVFGSRRNCLGPLHWAGPEPARWVGPDSFVSKGELWQDEYRVVTHGLMKKPYLSYRT